MTVGGTGMTGVDVRVWIAAFAAMTGEWSE